MSSPPYTLTSGEQERIARIDELVTLGAASVPALLAAISDPSWTVRRAAVAGLAALGDEAVGPLAGWLREQRTSEHAIAAAVDALVGSLGATVTAAALELLESQRPAVVADGATILGRRRAAEAADQLAALLRHTDDNVAIAAIEALGMLSEAGPPGVAIEPLIAAIERRSFFRTFPALQVLARTGDPRAVRPIAELLDDPLYGAAAIGALGRTGSPFAIAPLAVALHGGDVAAVRTIAGALADLVARAEWSGAATQIARSLGAALGAALPRLVQAIPGSTPAELGAIIVLLGRGGDAGVVPVLASLIAEPPDDAPEARALAVDAIRRLADARDIALLDVLDRGDAATRIAVLPIVRSSRDAPSVRALLRDPDSEVRARACEALARLGDLAAVPALFAALADPSPRVGLAATGAVQSLHTSDTLARVVAALADPAPGVRRNALRIAAYLGLRDAFDAVHAATADPDRRVAELAVIALGAMPGAKADAALATIGRSPDPALRAATLRAWGQRGTDAAIAPLEAGLADPDAWVRYYACQGLGRLGAAPSMPLVLARLADDMPHVRIAAIEALARSQTRAAWDALTAAARSSDPDERRAALIALGQRGLPEALPILLEAARSGDLATRLVALSGLATQASGEAAEELARAARDPEPALHEAALSLLAERDDHATARALIELASDAAPTHPVHRALSRPSPIRIAAIGDALQASDDVAAVVLAAALARMAVPAATARLLQALATATPGVRRAAATSLFAIGDEGARAHIVRLATEDPDPEVRRLCAALTRGA